MSRLLLLALALLIIDCTPPTEFKGEPKVAGGRTGCVAKCNAQGLELAGMVFMGEYSDGCVCRVKGSAAPPPTDQAGATLGAGAAAAGVVMARRAREAAARQRQQQQQQQQSYQR
ncbi:MAG: hypothetical protein IPI67_38565 [Myxococcales bacterium]|nr:hypothetical protein [Myxococcales bacterium]